MCATLVVYKKKKKPARAHVSNVCVRIYFATSARVCVCGIQQNRPRRHGIINIE